MTSSPLDSSAVDLAVHLEGMGVHAVLMEWVNSAGLAHAKVVPLRRVADAARSGLGGSPVFHVFCVDGSIAFTDDITAVGDQRMVLDPSSVRPIGGGWAWGAGSFFDQDGRPDPRCSRQVLTRVERDLEEHGFEARVGHELEFVIVNSDGTPLDSAWVPYGVTGVLQHQDFIDDLLTSAHTAGLAIEQIHAEYGAQQFEFSIAPAGPVTAADNLVLARTLVCRLLRERGLAASFSPVPFAGHVGNGAHQHFSLTHHGRPLFAGGDGPHGLTTHGASAIGGLLKALPDIQGILTGSTLSGERLQPGGWAGACACWGTENREAAVRFIKGGPANPLGANVEVKCIDPSANPYLATAAILGACLVGIDENTPLPSEVVGDPSKMSAEERQRLHIKELSRDAITIMDRLTESALAQRIIGLDAIATTAAVRRYELSAFADATPESRADALRLAWSG